MTARIFKKKTSSASSVLNGVAPSIALLYSILYCTVARSFGIPQNTVHGQDDTQGEDERGREKRREREKVARLLCACPGRTGELLDTVPAFCVC